jgi:hypothetical protein
VILQDAIAAELRAAGGSSKRPGPFAGEPESSI